MGNLTPVNALMSGKFSLIIAGNDAQLKGQCVECCKIVSNEVLNQQSSKDTKTQSPGDILGSQKNKEKRQASGTLSGTVITTLTTQKPL